MKNFLPASVKAAAERSDALIKGLNGTPEGTDPASAEPGKTPDGNTPSDPNAAPTKDPAPATLPIEKSTEDFETKYRTLQGKYNAEIPRLNEQVRTLTSRVSFLTGENASLKADKNNNADPNGSDAGDGNSRLNPDDLGKYGEEFGAMATRVNSLIDENEALKEQLGTVSGRVDTVKETQGQTDYNRYMGTVAKQVTDLGRDFNQLNADPDFLTWLQDIHAFTGQPRHASLQAAEANLDVERTMGIFKEYLGLDPTKKQSNKKPDTKEPKPTVPTPNLQPDHKPSGSDITPPMSTSEQIWTRGKAKQLYEAKARGDWRGKDAEFKALEADMFAAQTEGRFR
ncbi:MAG: hypothetical protein JEZ12_16000 [Desulfobacterium sp.]|nr:hypothetical protein [Desulfobacterium sp.]